MSNMKTNCTPARDPGAVGRDDVIFSGDSIVLGGSLYQEYQSAPGSPRMTVKQP